MRTKKKKVKHLNSETNRVNNKLIILDFPGFGGFGGDDEVEDEDDIHAPEEHVHGDNCNQDYGHKQANLDDLDAEETK